MPVVEAEFARLEKLGLDARVMWVARRNFAIGLRAAAAATVVVVPARR